MCISYAQSIAEDFAHKSRSLMESQFYQGIFDTRLSSERKALGDFQTTKGGSRVSESLSGSLTGRGADLIILDDPIKAEDVLSDAKRASVNASFYNTVYGRLNNKQTGAIVIIMQRLHMDDIVAHVTERERWDVVKFSAVAEQGEVYAIKTPYGYERIARAEGSALHPARESAEVWAERRKTMGDQIFATQYQQNPLPIGGGIIKEEWLQYYEEPPADYDRVIQSWDTASRVGATNSYNVCTTWRVARNHFYLTNVYRERGDFDKLKAAAVKLAFDYQPSTIVVEAQSNGYALISDLRTRTRFNVVEGSTTAGSKPSRLEAIVDRFSGGFVHLPRDAHWLREYVRELTMFPSTRYSDQVDSTVHALTTVPPGDDGSFARAMETVRLMSVEPEDELVRLQLPPNAGSFYGRDGRQIVPDAEGIIIVDRITAASLQQANQKIRRL